MRALVLLLFFIIPISLFSYKLTQIGCGISEPLGDDVMERKVALSRAIKNSFSTLLEGILGSELFLEVKDDFLKEMLDNPEDFILEYAIKEEKRLDGGGYLVCVLVAYDRKMLFRKLSELGLVGGRGKKVVYTFSYFKLKNYDVFKKLRSRLVGFEGIDLVYIKTFFKGNGTMEVVSSLGPGDVKRILEDSCLPDLCIPEETNGTISLEFIP